MKEFEEVRAKMLGYPPEATVPLSREEINALIKGATYPQDPILTSGYVFGRHFGLEARPGSKLTEEAVIAAAREVRGIRLGDHFNVRCPVVFSMVPIPIEDLEAGRLAMTSAYETFLFDEKMAARVKESH